MLGLPDLLVLDEPTNGLDPPQIHAMREVLRSYAATGRTVIVSSHLLSEIEQTCSHVVVMAKGQKIAQGTVEEIVGTGGAVSVGLVDDADTDRAITVLESLPGVTAGRTDEGWSPTWTATAGPLRCRRWWGPASRSTSSRRAVASRTPSWPW
ncbi:AAA family ATPase [Blastococcus brunescens]|uniref:AAA family ATPase n=2 Tax=Blastococcus brunescens TaxID=1564165 RepID=A0ABZ1B9H9_9ACTN|nr:AAA family ATPase [Blastococcus sp. BMG 8361]WRL66816.1 AAA family ATPase [Blastococcus sp. BMG 8361]